MVSIDWPAELRSAAVSVGSAGTILLAVLCAPLLAHAIQIPREDFVGFFLVFVFAVFAFVLWALVRYGATRGGSQARFAPLLVKTAMLVVFAIGLISDAGTAERRDAIVWSLFAVVAGLLQPANAWMRRRLGRTESEEDLKRRRTQEYLAALRLPKGPERTRALLPHHVHTLVLVGLMAGTLYIFYGLRGELGWLDATLAAFVFLALGALVNEWSWGREY